MNVFLRRYSSMLFSLTFQRGDVVDRLHGDFLGLNLSAYHQSGETNVMSAQEQSTEWSAKT